jgi:ABC-type nitrate/sulfonate/bicarbonate transport system permease component
MPAVVGKHPLPGGCFAARLAAMTTTLWSAAIGCFLGFLFGVGCSLAVMYSIYLGGYRAAVKDSQTVPPPERLTRALAKLHSAAAGNR